jgi:hypothetical protein
MIISRKHRYVYLELPRTGSSAVSVELRENYDGHSFLFKHATYRDFLRNSTPDERKYFAFSGIRNPLDVAVTRYAHLSEDTRGHFSNPEQIAMRRSIAGRLERRIYRWVQETKPDFETFLARVYVLPYDTWSSLDHKRLDALIHFENLADDFGSVLRRLGIDPVRPLPVRNATPGRDRDYLSYYTPGAIRQAVRIFGPYMQEWGYGFPEAWGRVRVPLSSRILYRIARVPRSFYWRFFRYRDYVKMLPARLYTPPERAREQAELAEELRTDDALSGTKAT